MIECKHELQQRLCPICSPMSERPMPTGTVAYKKHWKDSPGIIFDKENKPFDGVPWFPPADQVTPKCTECSEPMAEEGMLVGGMFIGNGNWNCMECEKDE